VSIGIPPKCSNGSCQLVDLNARTAYCQAEIDFMIQALEELLKSSLMGPIWESFVFAYLWHDRSKEADILIDRGGRFELHDAKWTEHPKSGRHCKPGSRRKTSGCKEYCEAIDRQPAAQHLPDQPKQQGGFSA
jgi:hypothetical protein